MKLHNLSRLLVGAILTTSTLAVTGAASAQRFPERSTSGVAQTFPGLLLVQEPVRLPCCRCLDGTTTAPLNVSTGTGPWNVAFGSAAAQPVASASNVAWTAVPPGQWVGPSGNAAIGDYNYTMPFQVPKCVIPMQVTISGKFAADNSAKLYVDGNFVKASQGTPNYGFLPGSVTPFSWTGTLSPGPHAIKVVVTNSSGPTGLVVAATITVTCPKEIEQ